MFTLSFKVLKLTSPDVRSKSVDLKNACVFLLSIHLTSSHKTKIEKIQDNAGQQLIQTVGIPQQRKPNKSTKKSVQFKRSKT